VIAPRSQIPASGSLSTRWWTGSPHTPGLVTSEPEAVTVGGLDGVFLNMSLAPSWIARPPVISSSTARRMTPSSRGAGTATHRPPCRTIQHRCWPSVASGLQTDHQQRFACWKCCGAKGMRTPDLFHAMQPANRPTRPATCRRRPPNPTLSHRERPTKPAAQSVSRPKRPGSSTDVHRRPTPFWPTVDGYVRGYVSTPCHQPDHAAHVR
jgi:hypothetical protein